MTRRSLRGRILAGALLWTAGLLAAATAVMVHLVELHPATVRAVHAVFSNLFLVTLVAGLAMVAGLYRVRGGLAALDGIRSRLAAVHRGRDRRVEGTYPREVQPLVDDLNALLAHQEDTVRRAVAKAGDLAHGLKTPLAVLTEEARRAADGGDSELAASVLEQVERMRRQVDYHLAQARAAASGSTIGTGSPVAPSVEGLARTLGRLHHRDGLAIEARIPAELVVRCQREDLDEMLGNLMDNACKWARSSVVVAASRSPAGVTVTVDDDGPGIEPALRETVLRRGVRADQAATGSGLGLAIVAELADLYGGSIALDASPRGGLRARLDLPGIDPRSNG